MKQRYFIKLAYLGTAYHGWQYQQNVTNTVQQVLDEAISGLLNETVETMGCGRTDAGVHAREFYAHFDSEKLDLHLPHIDWVYKFNCVLPNDIVVYNILKVKASANARFDATSRTYEYHIVTTPDPFSLGRAFYQYGSLNLAKMQSASDLLQDYNDFSCFSKSNTQVKTANCKISHANWQQYNNLLVFTITANRFLRNMVRAITGTLLDVGKNKLSVADVRKIIESRNRSNAGLSVPAHGLYLTRIIYPSHIFFND